MAVPSQEILVTVLPAGRSPQKPALLRISLCFSPRLVSAPGREELREFPDWADWPRIAAGLRARLVFHNAVTVPLHPDFGDDAPDRAAWAALFPGDTWVRPFSFTKLLGRRIRSFPASTIVASAAGLYGGSLADVSGEFPEATTLDKSLGGLGRLRNPDVSASFNKKLDSLFSDLGVVPAVNQAASGFGGAAQYAFFQAERFYHRPKAPGSNPYRERPDPAFVAKPVDVPKLDFHQGVAAVGDYPRVMRRLGLVLDFVFERPAGIPDQGSLSVEIKWPEGFPQSPGHVNRSAAWTAYEFAGDFFGPRFQANGPHVVGYLDLRNVSDDPFDEKRRHFALLQVDVDGTALKTVDFAASLTGRSHLANYRTPTRWSLPVVRTSGVSVLRIRRDEALAQRLLAASQQNTTFAGGTKVQLSGEDVVRGYRLDVLDLDAKRPEWRSLCLRRGRYTFLGGDAPLVLELDDEGYVKSASTTGEDGGSTDLYLHERMFSFEGWSLVAPRPGKTLASDPTSSPAAPENKPVDLPLATWFRAQPGTLPRLRFGHRYRLRVRVVDIAGNSVPLDKNDEFASAVLTYMRFEPIASPAVVPRAAFGEGESLEHLVIRSDFDRTTAAYVADPEVQAALAGANHVYAEANDRHFAPPKTSQLEAEVHGRFDDFIGAGNSPAKGFHLASRESGTFFDTDIVDLSTGARVPIPGADLRLISPAGVAPTDLATRKPGDPLQQGEYIVRAEAQLTVPYLPDPFARGVALRGIPGDPLSVRLIPFGGPGADWPEGRPFRFRIVERPGALVECEEQFADSGEPKWDDISRVLTVFLPKGTIAEVRFSCYLAKEDWAQMGLQKWWRGTAAARQKLDKLVLSGGHWLITPWRTLTLVHAVQRPLCPPRWLVLGAGRDDLGVTHATLSGRARLSVPTTGQLDLYGRWTEQQDRALEDGTWPATSSHEGHVLQLGVDPNWKNLQSLPDPHGAQPRLQHEFGDTKHRNIRYRLKGTTRFREYLPPAIAREDVKITRVGPEIVVSVPSSARPKAPQVVDILPSFKWIEAELAGGGISRTRRGNALRVYLERGWFSSGDDELLGVVFTRETITKRIEPFVTQWGLDPMFASTAPVAAITPGAFSAAAASGAGLSLAETGDSVAVYQVSGHRVYHDPARDLLYTDIEVAAGLSYFPFIRLALARFQPQSIANAHLSRVVQTEFQQLVPDRTATVRPAAGGRFAFQLFGRAPTETFVSKNTGLCPAALQPGGLLHPGTGAVAPFAKPGLNRYEITAQYLPAGASPDFGWKNLEGVVLHKPGSLVATLPKGKIPLRTKAAAARKVTAAARTSAVVSEALSQAKLQGPVTRVPGKIEFVELGELIQPKPLWAADIAIPTAPDNAPRRLVVEEFELHFHEADDRSATGRTVAKRLVYADILPL
jgi:hypothetical protein